MTFESPIKVALDSLCFPYRTFSLDNETAFRYLQVSSEIDFGEDLVAWINWAAREGFVEDDYPGDGVLDGLTKNEQ